MTSHHLLHDNLVILTLQAGTQQSGLPNAKYSVFNQEGWTRNRSSAHQSLRFSLAIGYDKQRE